MLNNIRNVKCGLSLDVGPLVTRSRQTPWFFCLKDLGFETTTLPLLNLRFFREALCFMQSNRGFILMQSWHKIENKILTSNAHIEKNSFTQNTWTNLRTRAEKDMLQCRDHSLSHSQRSTLKCLVLPPASIEHDVRVRLRACPRIGRGITGGGVQSQLNWTQVFEQDRARPSDPRLSRFTWLRAATRQ